MRTVESNSGLRKQKKNHIYKIVRSKRVENKLKQNHGINAMPEKQLKQKHGMYMVHECWYIQKKFNDILIDP